MSTDNELMSETNNQYYCVIISRGLLMHPCLLVPNRSPGCEGGRLGIGFTGFEPNRRATPIFDANLGRSSMNATWLTRCVTRKRSLTLLGCRAESNSRHSKPMH